MFKLGAVLAGVLIGGVAAAQPQPSPAAAGDREKDGEALQRLRRTLSRWKDLAETCRATEEDPAGHPAKGAPIAFNQIKHLDRFTVPPPCPANYKQLRSDLEQAAAVLAPAARRARVRELNQGSNGIGGPRTVYVVQPGDAVYYATTSWKKLSVPQAGDHDEGRGKSILVEETKLDEVGVRRLYIEGGERGVWLQCLDSEPLHIEHDSTECRTGWHDRSELPPHMPQQP